MFYVVNTQIPEAQSIFRYDGNGDLDAAELDAIVAYYNTLASNYSAYKAGTLTGFTVAILDADLKQYVNYYEKR